MSRACLVFFPCEVSVMYTSRPTQAFNMVYVGFHMAYVRCMSLYVLQTLGSFAITFMQVSRNDNNTGNISLERGKSGKKNCNVANNMNILRVRNYQTPKVQKPQQYKTEATKKSILELLTLNAASFLADKKKKSPFSTYPPPPENWYIPWKLIFGSDDLPKWILHMIPFLLQMKIPLKKMVPFSGEGFLFSNSVSAPVLPFWNPLFDAFKCTPPKFNMEPEKKSPERKFILETIIFRFHAKFQGSNPNVSTHWTPFFYVLPRNP